MNESKVMLVRSFIKVAAIKVLPNSVFDNPDSKSMIYIMANEVAGKAIAPISAAF